MNWELLLIMPDLQLSGAVDAEYMAIAPYEDERIQSIIADSSEAKKLLTGFSDYKGDSVEPAALILRKDAPDSTRSLEAAVALRNTLALSTVLYSTSGNFAPVYSDSFDFYPVQPTGSGKGFVTLTPALHNFSLDTSFVGTTNPGILRTYPGMTPKRDQLIFYPLRQFWKQKFVQNTENRFLRVLFRSLQLAYQASSMPYKNQGSLHDYGVTAALWVNALEILAHPEDDDVCKKHVLTLLGQHEWNTYILNNHNYEDEAGRKGNLIQYLCKRLYEVRNDFIHGNPVDDQTLIISDKQDASSLPLLAPVIYRTTLFQYMMREIGDEELPVLFCGHDELSSDNLQDYHSARITIEANYEDRLLEAVDLN